MAKTSKLVSLIKEIVRQEVQKEVKQIFIKEGMKSMAQQAAGSPRKRLSTLPLPMPFPARPATC